VGEGRLVVPTGINQFATPVQLAKAGLSAFGKRPAFERLGGMVNPVLEAMFAGAFQRDPFTGRELEGGALQAAAGSLTQGLPQVLLGKRLAEAGTPKMEGRIYPYDRLSAAGQFALGSSAPRPYNPEALHEAWKREALNPLSRIEKLRAEREAVLPALRGKMPPADVQRIRQAYTIAEGIERVRVKAKQETGDGEPYYRAVLAAEARYMGSIGIFPSEDVARLVSIAEKGTYDEVRRRRDFLIQGPFERIYLKAKRNGRKIAGYKP